MGWVVELNCGLVARICVVTVRLGCCDGDLEGLRAFGLGLDPL